MNVTPLLSIMIPTCERSDYLEAALKSALAVDASVCDLEICVIDNASINPKIESITHEVAGGRVRLFRQSERVSVSENWNTCWRQANGVWVHILHDDDTLFLKEYNAFIARLQTIDRDCVFGGVIKIDAYGNALHDSIRPQEKEGPPTLSIRRNMVFGNCVPVCSVLVRRDAYVRSGGFNSSLKYCVDWEMWSRFFRSGSVWCVPYVLGCYRAHGGISDGNRQALKPYVYDEMIRVGWDNLNEYNKSNADSRISEWNFVCRVASNRIAVSLCLCEFALAFKYFRNHIKVGKEMPFRTFMLVCYTFREMLVRFPVFKRITSWLRVLSFRRHPWFSVS